MGTSNIMRAMILLLVFALAHCDEQKDALMDLHDSTNGASWSRSDNWGKADDVCTWFGVSCNHDPPGTSQVYSVILGANNLKGAIPASVIKMKSLKVLDLSDNQLTGEVPSGFETLPDLQQVL